MLDEVRENTQSQSLSGPEIKEHNEHRALRILTQGLKVLGLREEDLPHLAKGALEKQLLAWHIRNNTTVSNQWLSEHLHSGHPGNLARYLRYVAEATDKKTRSLKNSLRACVDPLCLPGCKPSLSAKRCLRLCIQPGRIDGRLGSLNETSHPFNW